MGRGVAARQPPFACVPGGKYHNVYFISDDSYLPSVKKCNALKYKEGKRQINISLVFKNLDLEMKFDNSTRATCIPYIDLVEILNLQLGYEFG